MKKIIVNGQSLNEKETYGIQRNTIQILFELDRIIEKGTVELILPPWETNHLKFENIVVNRMDVLKIGKSKKFLWNHKYFPRYVKDKGGIGVDMLLAMPILGCDVISIYDCIPERFPQNYLSWKDRLKRKFYMYKVGNAVHKSKIILTDSNSAKVDISTIYHCNPQKIRVIYCGWQHFESVTEDETVIEKLNLQGKKYCFSLGSHFVHKNHRWIMAAAEQNPKYTFVVTGSDSISKSDKGLKREMPENVIYTGYLSDEELKALMKNCMVFIQPSLYEGFGIPPMEAMSTGTRCIVSNMSSLPEVYGHSVWYIDPYQYNDIDIDRIMSEEIDDNDLVLHKFSWEKSARELKKIFDKLARGETL